MFIYESNFLFFFVLSTLIAFTLTFRVFRNPFSFVKLYLYGIVLFALMHPSLFYFFDQAYNSISGYEFNSSYSDLFFLSDFLFLFLLGGFIASRSENILKRHFYLSVVATIVLTSSLFMSVVNESDIFRHIVICMSLMVLLVSLSFEVLKSLLKLSFGKSLLMPFLFCSLAGACLWLAMVFLIISFVTAEQIPLIITQNIFNFWLILKTFFVFLCFCFFDFVDNEEQQIFSEILVKNVNVKTRHMTLACLALYKLPYPVFITAVDGNIEFSNSESIKLLGAGDLDDKNISNVFLTIEPSSSTSSLATIKLADKSLQMFKLKYFSISINQSKKNICCIERVDFDFSAFCHGIVAKGNNISNKIFGLLDHNFAIYRMSSAWTELLNPFDKFFHSGLIWDKLNILSEDKLEISYLENSIASSSESSAWLNLRSGSSIKVTIVKLYAPDFRHFYLFSTELIGDVLDSDKIENYVSNKKYITR